MPIKLDIVRGAGEKRKETSLKLYETRLKDTKSEAINKTVLFRREERCFIGLLIFH